ncbi:allophanate hydrolase subunit 2 family protein, partial [Vibrio cholerae CP1035(8)]
GTTRKSRDFKSLVSTDFTTRARKIFAMEDTIL